MAKHGEREFILPALKVLYFNKHAVTSQIKDEIHKYIQLSDEDLSNFDSRSIKEPAYRQVVGNLISHKNKAFFSYVQINDGSSMYPKGSFSLTPDGESYIKKIIEEDENDVNINYVENDLLKEGENLIAGIDSKYMNSIMENGIDKRPAINNSLKETVIELSGRKCEYATLTNTSHNTFDVSNGKQYVVTHHLIPISARLDFFPRNLDRPSNLVCLCPNCHHCIHYGTKEEKIKMLKVLYEKHIDALNDEQIYISFDELLEKYYL